MQDQLTWECGLPCRGTVRHRLTVTEGALDGGDSSAGLKIAAGCAISSRAVPVCDAVVVYDAPATQCGV